MNFKSNGIKNDTIPQKSTYLLVMVLMCIIIAWKALPEQKNMRENKAMGIYFIADPNGYWFEIIPTR